MDRREQARELIGRLTDAYNRKDEAAMAALYAPEVRYWSALGLSEGREAVLDHVRTLFRELPDERMSPRTVVTDGDTVVVEFVSRGTDGAGSPYEIEFTEVLRVAGGLLFDIRVYLDPEAVAAITTP